MRCEICQSTEVTSWSTVSNYDYYRCLTCRYMYVHPKPSAEGLERYYQAATFYSKAESDESRLIAEAKSRVKILSKLAQKYGLTRHLLDVGCASGIFLEQARKNGWGADGIDVSAPLCVKARAKGLSIATGWIEEVAVGKKYPVVTAWEVIEHAIDPAKFLDKLRSCVQSGGLVAVSTPLSNGLPATLLGSRFPMMCPPEHVGLFSRKSLIILGRRVGLKVVCFRSFSNLKRENLERALLRFVFAPLSVPKAVGRILCVLFGRILVPAARVMDAVGMGSEIEIVFRRER